MRLRQHARLIVLLMSLFVLNHARASDMLCVTTVGQAIPECSTAARGELAVVKPANHPRQALWISSDQSQIVVLEVRANQQRVQVPRDGNEIRFAIRTRRLPRGVRVIDYKLTDVGSGRSWDWTLPGRVEGGSIVAPDGTYMLALSAPQVRGITVRKIQVGPDHRLAKVDPFDLQPMLFITGRLVDDAGLPVVGATVTNAVGAQVAVSDGDGAFTVDDVADELPAAVSIGATGYVTRDLTVPDRRQPLNAGDVILERGHDLTVRITFDPAEAIPERTSVAVYRVGPDRLKKLVQREPLSADAALLTFKHVGSGKHVVEVAGPQPLQRRGVVIEMSPSFPSDPVEIAIIPRTLDGHVYFGSEPLQGGTIAVYPRHQLWRAELILGAEGEFGGSLWEDGLLGAMVQGGALSIPFVADKEIVKREEDWDVVIPNNSVRGRVVDSQTKRGIAHAKVMYESLGARMRISSLISADEAGHYAITGVSAGTLSVRASAPGYLNSEPVTVAVGGTEASHEQMLSLEAGAVVEVQVVDDQQRPVAGATLVDPVLGPSRFSTSATGGVSIPVSSERPRRLWIVPKEGSLAPVTLRADDSQPVRAVVRSGTGSIRVSARTDDSTVIPHLRFAVRYNGEFVPDDVWRVVAHVQGFDWVTGSDGIARHPRLPPGLYEFWPYVAAAEGRGLAMSPGVIAPVAKFRLNAGDDQVVTVILRPKP